MKTKINKNIRKIDLSLSKLSIGVGLGVILSVIFFLRLTNIIEYSLIRWEYIIPPIVAIYYLSVQPYLNFASAKRYFVSGALVAGILAGIILIVDAIFSLSIINQLDYTDNIAGTILAYFLFILSYSLVGGVGHYLFNKNVDPAKKDVKRPQFFGLSLIVGAFSFVVIALLINIFGQNNEGFYALFVPVTIAAFTVVKLHKVEPRAFYKGLVLGGLTGLSMGVVQSVLLLLSLLFQLIINREFTEAIVTNNISVGASSIIFLIPILVVFYTIIGSFVGFIMKLLKSIL